MFDAALWANTSAEGGFADKVDPPLGQHVISISEGKFTLTGENKDKPTIVVGYLRGDGVTWDDVKQLTSEGRVKSAKILMRDLRLDVENINTPEEIHAALKSVEGKYFAVDNKQSTTLKPDGSGYYINTSIIGPWEGTPIQPAPVAAPVQPVAPESDIPNGLPPVQPSVPAVAPAQPAQPPIVQVPVQPQATPPVVPEGWV